MKNIQIRIKYENINGIETNTTASIKDTMLNVYSRIFFEQRYTTVKKEVNQRIRKNIINKFKEQSNLKNISQIITHRMLIEIQDYTIELKNLANK